jgi:hypothetical protein
MTVKLKQTDITSLLHLKYTVRASTRAPAYLPTRVPSSVADMPRASPTNGALPSPAARRHSDPTLASSTLRAPRPPSLPGNPPPPPPTNPPSAHALAPVPPPISLCDPCLHSSAMEARNPSRWVRPPQAPHHRSPPHPVLV